MYVCVYIYVCMCIYIYKYIYMSVHHRRNSVLRIVKKRRIKNSWGTRQYVQIFFFCENAEVVRRVETKRSRLLSLLSSSYAKGETRSSLNKQVRVCEIEAIGVSSVFWFKWSSRLGRTGGGVEGVTGGVSRHPTCSTHFGQNFRWVLGRLSRCFNCSIPRPRFTSRRPKWVCVCRVASAWCSM
jgi:hypothetical protein